MDEPLLCCRMHIHKSDDYALEETANFIARVRQQYPGMLIGDIETWLETRSRSTPETEPWTFTRSVLDFTRKFVRQNP